MLLKPAVETDFAEVVDLANVAYRKTGPGSSWNSETGLIEGSRTTEAALREDLAKKPGAELLTFRDGPGGPLLGTVWVEPKGEGIWYLGLLTVRPDLQNRQLGRGILAAAEEYARERGGRRIRMTVLWVRETLIAWYERRGYEVTDEKEPFPYGDERFGKPLRDDLYFVVLTKAI
jgi:GNAT superfamily N-acetyltransferase